MELAVNIIFSLPMEIAKNAIDISTKHQSNSKQKIQLGPEKNVAHISLWMGIISDSKIKKLHQKINILMQQKKLPKIVLTHIDYSKKNSDPVFSFQVEKNDSLVQWHYQISEIAKEYALPTIAKKKHFSEKVIHDSSMNYLDKFDKYYSQKNYQAHITLGFGTHKQKLAKNSFTPSGIAIYHLGNYCSCHQLIKKITPDQQAES